MKPLTLALLALAASQLPAPAQLTPALPSPLPKDLDARIASVMPKVVAWPRDLTEYPELSYSEERTAGLVAASSPAGNNALSALALDALLRGVGQAGALT